jgi:hypothetical protein
VAGEGGEGDLERGVGRERPNMLFYRGRGEWERASGRENGRPSPRH